MVTYLRTSSSFDRLNILRILLARLGPRMRGFSSSVRPGSSCSPFLTITKFRTDRSGDTTQPRTDFRRRSPFLRPWPLKPWSPGVIRRRTRLLVRTPCFMAKPCLSWPPAIFRT
ncbi:hypothetical protein Vafri_11969 [Volvox africanus]|uniref:Uncharacterized protein n=1 Tax=Volvox africanus TaxID=51714 RepID=A0A8J4F278_9CHLO|nr:hypothetical protein Vafri_11969 [Volvox africanus]